MVFFFWQMLEMYYLENIVLTALKLRCPAIPSQKRVLNQIQVRSVIELESFNSYLQLLFNSLLTTKRRHLDCDKVNPGAHDKGSWWILRLFLLLVVRSCAPFAGVASVSNPVIVPKLERQQNKVKEGEGGGDERFLFSPSPPFSFLASFLLRPNILYELPRKRLLRRLYDYSFFFLSSFLSLSLSFFLSFFFSIFLKTIISLQSLRKPCIQRPFLANCRLTA